MASTAAGSGCHLPSVLLSTVQSQPGSGYPTSTMVQRIRLPNADINVLVQPS